VRAEHWASSCTVLRAKYLVDAPAFNKVQGKPFKVARSAVESA
jgi:hypothetical protein